MVQCTNNRQVKRADRLICAQSILPILIFAVFFTVGCSRKPKKLTENQKIAPAGMKSAGSSRPNLDISTPIILLRKQRGQVIYSIHGEEMSESEVIELTKRLASYSKETTVYLVPSIELSADEAELERARLREESGLSNVIILENSQDIPTMPQPSK